MSLTRLQFILNLTHTFGMSIPENQVLSTVSYGIVLPPEQLAAQTLGEVQGDPKGTFSLDEYTTAIESCIDKG